MREDAAESAVVRILRAACFALIEVSIFTCTLTASQLNAQQNPKLTINWDKVTVVSKSTPTLQVVVNPPSPIALSSISQPFGRLFQTIR